MTWKAVNTFLTRPKPITLTDEELRSAEDTTEPATPPRVKAWVRYPEATVEVEGRVLAFNERVALVEYDVLGGETQGAWVWRSAVTDQRPEPR
ncbi:hypothetical protein ACFJGV_10765 [Cnuibacter sp. UC19_7]|uniref:hypothetical protein n=1 Tax=Cnuibacter sp. UC19_7 TaxID=3350166 RepID=UPI00366DCD76